MQNEKEQQIKIFYSKDWSTSAEATAGKQDYEFLDSGEGEKLEKFGKYIFVRPYENASWKKTLSAKEWSKIDGKFWSSRLGAKAGWKLSRGTLDKSKWEMSYKDIKFIASPTPFRHLGFFPEQASHWDFIEEKIKNAKRPIKFLNLFGYTGVASLFALRAGAEVTHIDASKSSVEWAKENEKLNTDLGLDKMPIKIICEDAIKFLEREIKRGNKYDAVIMDPPKFGRGPKGETWQIEKDLPKLLSQVRKVLSDKPLFLILTSYAIDSSSLSLSYALADTMKDFSGTTKAGELCILEKSNKRLIPLANTAIWAIV